MVWLLLATLVFLQAVSVQPFNKKSSNPVSLGQLSLEDNRQGQALDWHKLGLESDLGATREGQCSCKNEQRLNPSLSRLNANIDSADDHNSTDNETCPLWYIHDNTTCKCGTHLGGIIHCDDEHKSILLLACNCMSFLYSNSQQIAVVGACIYNCFPKRNKTDIGDYIQLPKYTSELDYLCEHHNREGLMCSQCLAGYFPPIYSYDLKCVKCTNTNVYYNTAKYVLVAFLPLTVFLFVIIYFRISATTAKLNAFIFVSQVIASLPSAQIILGGLDNHSHAVKIMARIAFSMYGIWNLDFFRGFISPICLDINARQAIALDYLVGFYPLVLLAIAYFLIELHDRGYRLVLLLWRPFHKCFYRIRREWDIRTSVIDAFATFLVLAYVKLFSVSVETLMFVTLSDASGHVMTHFYSFYDATLDITDKTHLILTVFGLIFTLISILLPILLILYPLQCFQKILNRYGLRCQALHAFTDTFQGCYKNRKPDCRSFAAVYFFGRIVLFLAYSTTLSIYYFALAVLLLMVLVAIIVIWQPYKPQYAMYNKVDTLLVLVLAMWYCSILGLHESHVLGGRYQFPFALLSGILFLCPFIYITTIFLHWLFWKGRFPQRLLRRCQLCRRCAARRRRGSGAELLPDRLINPGNYGAVLQHVGADDNDDLGDELEDNDTY